MGTLCAPSLSHPFRDAAALACVCRGAAAAAPFSKWHRAARVGPGGAVLEPASGTFDVTVAPGEGVQAAVDACPAGGAVLLLPGNHLGPMVLAADRGVHVFGRGQATLRTGSGTTVASAAAEASLDGLFIREGPSGHFTDICVKIERGSLRLQACDISSCGDGINLYNVAKASIINCRFEGGGRVV